MNKRLAEIKRRQERLIARAGAQRDEIVRISGTWRQPLRVIDEVFGTVRRLRFHPVLAAVGQSLLLTVAPRYRFLLLWAGRAFVGWEVYRTTRELWPKKHSRETESPELEQEAERRD
ncbi:MAG: YqjK family protein [Acidiferrobacteraceae bacterium]|jgi:threonine/homoserine/homoserine lactone efflux protein